MHGTHNPSVRDVRPALRFAVANQKVKEKRAWTSLTVQVPHGALNNYLGSRRIKTYHHYYQEQGIEHSRDSANPNSKQVALWHVIIPDEYANNVSLGFHVLYKQ